jgi:hypothetical protein
MQIVINIDEKIYASVMDGTYCGTLYQELKNGTPLPKGHGRIGDLDKLKANIEEYRDIYDRNGDDYAFGKYTAYDMSIDAIDETLTIIEADRSEEE